MFRWCKTGGWLLPILLAGGCSTPGVQRDAGRVAEARAVEFLAREVPAWPRENGCYSCHNNGDAARALFVAQRKGYRVPPAALADTLAWVSQPDQWEHNRGDPGFSDQRLANLQFAGSLRTAVEAGRMKNSRGWIAAMRKVAADQGQDGAWQIERPGNIGSPATYGTPLATFLAWRMLQATPILETKAATTRAARWLQNLTPDSILDAAVILLAAPRETDEPGRRKKEKCLELLRQAQTREGGWGPYRDSPAEPFDTAVVLLALAGLPPAPDRQEMIQSGRTYLLARQDGDGGWPPTTRPPGGLSYAQRLSTTGWATLALLETRK